MRSSKKATRKRLSCGMVSSAPFWQHPLGAAKPLHIRDASYLVLVYHGIYATLFNEGIFLTKGTGKSGPRRLSCTPDAELTTGLGDACIEYGCGRSGEERGTECSSRCQELHGEAALNVDSC